LSKEEEEDGHFLLAEEPVLELDEPHLIRKDRMWFGARLCKEREQPYFHAYNLLF
jgi:hypothetical protein